MSDNISKKPLEKSRTFHRLKITSNEEFTIPETASIFCSGGGIFRNGIAIGSNSSIIPGSIRYNNNNLQFRKLEDWINITGFFSGNSKENSIAKFGSDGELKDTSLFIENNDITGIELLESEYLVSPDNKDITITSTNNVNINTTGIGNINLNSTTISKNGTLNISNFTIPTSATFPGKKGDISWDENYVYICVKDNTWKRTNLSSW